MSESATTWIVRDVSRELGESDEAFLRSACERAGLPYDALASWDLVRRSVDARGRRAPRFQNTVALSFRESVTPGNERVCALPQPVEHPPTPSLPADAARPVIIGLGPCGIFAALHFLACGLRPIIIERGREVERRAKDVARLFGRGEINPESNLCFGEGGAGTWSDGKLYTRVKSPWIRHVLEELVALGAPERILVDGRPHMGTDRLVTLLKNARRLLLESGCEIHFDSRVTSLRTNKHNAVTGVALADGTIIDASHVILAIGHSARDVYRYLVANDVAIEAKPFAVGFRVEHPQALIDEAQYGRWADAPELESAYYELTTTLGPQFDKRGVYSFCMCPGGSVVATPTREGEVCVNGMSHAARSGRYANSALVATITPEDCARFSGDDSVLRGVSFQEMIEAKAWEAGGGAFVAPAQRLVDFAAGERSGDLRKTTYKRGVQSAALHELYPEAIRRAIEAALPEFNSRLRGFLSEDAVLIGVETRTSAPITILRDRERLVSPSHEGLYPAGEGAGYGGGIMSAALDGLRVAARITGELSQ